MEELGHLIRRSAGGDPEAFGQVVGRFQDMAVGYAYSLLGDFHLAEDAAQEAFLEAYRDLGQLRQERAFANWLRRLVFKQCDRLTRGKQLQTVPLEEQTAMAGGADPLEALTLGERRHQVQAAVAALREKERRVTALFYMADYSHREIAAFLDVPVSTVKKRLHDARKHLSQRMQIMGKKQAQENRPSKDQTFADRVAFFIALRDRDLASVKKLVDNNAQLLEAKAEWAEIEGGHMWMHGVTPPFWAAAVGDEALLGYLLDKGATFGENTSVKTNPPALNREELTPLHMAVLMSQAATARMLVERGAALDAPAQHRLTPLHMAVQRGDGAMVEFLADQGAALNAADSQGRTAADWAVLKGFADLSAALVQRGARPPQVEVSSATAKGAAKPLEVPAAKQALGRYLDGTGQALDGGPDLQGISIEADSLGGGSVLETGIKIVDFLVPLRRGGHTGLFSPQAGVGKLVLLSQIVRNVAALHNGYVVYLGLEDDLYQARDIALAWRGDFGVEERILEERMLHVFERADAPMDRRRQGVETGLALAHQLRRQGAEVLVVVESPLALVEGAMPLLRRAASRSPESSLSLLYLGDHSVGAEPAAFADLDGMISFSRGRAGQGLYPAVDPLGSCSALLEAAELGERHRDLARETRRLLRRYEGLHGQYETRGFDAFFHLDDRRQDEIIVRRARRLHRFLTQPFVGVEPFTGRPGERVSLADTLEGVEAIVEGRCDAWDEESFLYTGRLDQVEARP